jgi:hypothetical protein
LGSRTVRLQPKRAHVSVHGMASIATCNPAAHNTTAGRRATRAQQANAKCAAHAIGATSRLQPAKARRPSAKALLGLAFTTESASSFQRPSVTLSLHAPHARARTRAHGADAAAAAAWLMRGVAPFPPPHAASQSCRGQGRGVAAFTHVISGRVFLFARGCVLPRPHRPVGGRRRGSLAAAPHFVPSAGGVHCAVAYGPGASRSALFASHRDVACTVRLQTRRLQRHSSCPLPTTARTLVHWLYH